MRPRLWEPLASRVPWPIQQYVRDAEPKWEPLLEGIEHIPLTLAVNDNPVRLLRLAKGHHVSRHEHAGLEWFMVIDGSIDDSLSGNHYYRGDVCRNESGTVHHQTVGKQEPCIAMVARTAPFIARP
jgi:anti-sigma factor ChrR (cupin superfamily)